jgi:tryptophan synthase beta chain
MEVPSMHYNVIIIGGGPGGIFSAYELTKLEGIIPALESAHALGALEKLNFKPDDVVVLTVSGRGDKDIETYLNN